MDQSQLIRPEISRNTRRLRSIRNNYHNHVKRPVRTPPYVNNWILLEEGLEVYWVNIEQDIKLNINLRRWDILGILATAINVRGLSFEVPIQIPSDVAAKMVDAGIELRTEQIHADSIDINTVRRLTSVGIRVELAFNYTKLSVNEIRELVEAGAHVEARKLRLTTPPPTIEAYRAMGIGVTLSKSDNNYFRIPELINIQDNTRGQILTLEPRFQSTLIEYLKFVRVPFEYRDVVDFVLFRYCNLISEYHNLSDQDKLKLFIRSAKNDELAYIRYMINHEFQVDFDKIDLSDVSALSRVTILESLDIPEEDKYQLFKRFIKVSSPLSWDDVPTWDDVPINQSWGGDTKKPTAFRSSDYILFLHPSTNKYWRKLKQDPDLHNYLTQQNIDSLLARECVDNITIIGFDQAVKEYNANIVRKYIESGGEYNPGGRYSEVLLLAYDVLTQEQREHYFSYLVSDNYYYVKDETNPLFKELWSVVPSNRESYLWFLYDNGIQLPPEKNRGIVLPRIIDSDPVEVIKKLLPYNDDQDLLKFLNITKFNIRSMMGLNPKLDLLIERQPMVNVKGAHTK